jgi:hypothetical protein
MKQQVEVLKDVPLFLILAKSPHDACIPSFSAEAEHPVSLREDKTGARLSTELNPASSPV